MEKEMNEKETELKDDFFKLQLVIIYRWLQF